MGVFIFSSVDRDVNITKTEQNKEETGATAESSLSFSCCPQERSIRDTQFKCRHSCHLTYRANVIQSIPSFYMLEGISSRSFHLSDEKAYSFVSPPSFLLVSPHQKPVGVQFSQHCRAEATSLAFVSVDSRGCVAPNCCVPKRPGEPIKMANL